MMVMTKDLSCVSTCHSWLVVLCVQVMEPLRQKAWGGTDFRGFNPAPTPLPSWNTLVPVQLPGCVWLPHILAARARS